jgi:hypothetical protein
MGFIKSVHDLKQSHQAMIVMLFPHWKIHEGLSYSAHINSPVLGDGDSFEMYLKMPDSPGIRYHTVISFSGELGGIAELRRSASVSLSGTVVQIFNDDHNSSNVPTMTIRSSPSLTASGTQFAHFHVGGGFQGRDGGESGSRREFIGQQGTVYIARYTSIIAANEADINVSFYEED